MTEQGHPAVSDHQRQATGESPTTTLGEIYGRVVEVHYALAAAGRVDERLHHWCLDALNELLGFIDEAEHGEAANEERQREATASS